MICRRKWSPAALGGSASQAARCALPLPAQIRKPSRSPQAPALQRTQALLCPCIYHISVNSLFGLTICQRCFAMSRKCPPSHGSQAIPIA